MLNRMVSAHGTVAMCQYLGSLGATAVHRAVHVCISCMPFALTRDGADDTDTDRFEPEIDAAHLDR
jgi:hypothetical protein